MISRGTCSCGAEGDLCYGRCPSCHRAAENPVDTASLAAVDALVSKYMDLLAIRGERPDVKVTSALGARWFGRTVWSPRYPGTTTIELQRSITSDPRTLERVVAHEMVHHRDMIAPDRNLRTDGHGAAFLQGAAIVNAVMGPGFVTVTSDQDFVQAAHTKELYVLIAPFGNRDYSSGRLGWAWAARITPEAQEIIDAKVAHEGGRLVRTTDLKWTNSKAKIKKYGGLSIPQAGSTLEADLRALYDSAGGFHG